MLFSSLTFLVWFLPLVILGHLLMPVRFRNAFLLAASVFFYAWGEMRYVPLVLLSMGANYAFGRGCKSARAGVRRASLWASVALNIGALLYFKYAAFLLSGIGLSRLAPQVALPLGISFYTFQTQAYVIDVYKGRVPPEPRFVNYAAFILLFPQLIAGPIVLYTDVRRELASRKVTPQGLERGMGAFIAGLSAKVLLANPLGALHQGLSDATSTPAAYLGLIAFGLQIYFDFAGYSRMAIGMGRMMGFRFPQNFDNPYASRSVREFWRRWHMTLGSWFREYVYIPLGGSRGGTGRTVRNLCIVWALTGLWHGASWNFVLWGLWFFVFLVLERYLIGAWLSRHRWVALAYTLAVVFAGWVLFSQNTLRGALAYFGRLFAFAGGNDWQFALRGHAVLLLLAGACCVPGVLRGARRLLRRGALRTVCYIGLLLLCIAGLVGEGYNPFLYFRF